MSIVSPSLARKTYDVVRQRILTGEIAPNMPVRQDAIADELGISTIPIREALSRLEQDGLLISFPNRGYIVSPLTAQEATEVFDLRLKIEPEAVAKSALAATKEDRRIVRDALAALEAAQSNGTPGDHVTTNRLFHLAMVRPAAGLVTLQILERLYVLAERYVRVHLEPQGRDERARREHEDMLDAWLDRDVVVVETLVAAHIRATLEDLQKQLPI